MISASGAETGSRSRIGRSSIRQNDTTGAPLRSEPKLGNACAWRPSSNAASDSISAAVTTPWPPRPWMRTWNIAGSMLARTGAHYVGDRTHDGPGKLRLSRFLKMSSAVAASSLSSRRCCSRSRRRSSSAGSSRSRATGNAVDRARRAPRLIAVPVWLLGTLVLLHGLRDAGRRAGPRKARRRPAAARDDDRLGAAARPLADAAERRAPAGLRARSSSSSGSRSSCSSATRTRASTTRADPRAS